MLERIVRLRTPQLILALILGLHLGLLLYDATRETPTVDEYAHVPAGLTYWHTGTFSLYAKSPPLLRLWMTAPLLTMGLKIPDVQIGPYGWGPWLYGMAFEAANPDKYLSAFIWARLMIIVLSVGTGLVVYAWTRKLCPDQEWPPVLAAGGFWMAPTVLAHGHLATTDMGCTFLLFSCAFALSQRWFWRGTMLFAVALVAKFTAIFLIPWWLWCAWRTGWRKALGGLALVFAITWASYGFQGLFPAWGEIHFYSRLLQSLPLPKNFRVPLPRDLVSGFDAQLADTETGEADNYFLGELSRQGWWYYNLAAFALKETPVTLFLLFAIPWGLRGRWREIAPLWIPFVFLAVPLLFFNPLQIGVRYILPLFPFLFVLIALSWRRWTKSILALWVAMALIAAPGFISYFNPIALLVADKDEWLLDSNLDWGQDLYRVGEFAHSLTKGDPLYLLYFGHVSPTHYLQSYQLVPSQPVHGWVVVSPCFLRGLAYVTPAVMGQGFLSVPSDHLKWLRTHKPSLHLGSLLVYDLR